MEFDAENTFGSVSLPYWLLRDKDLDSGSKIFYSLLLHHAVHGCVWKNQTLLAEDMGVSIRQIKKYVSKLKNKEYIMVRAVKDWPNVCTFLNHPSMCLDESKLSPLNLQKLEGIAPFWVWRALSDL